MTGVDGLALNGWMALFACPMLAIWSLLFEEGQVDDLALPAAFRHAQRDHGGKRAIQAGDHPGS